MASNDFVVHVVDDEEAVRKSLAFLLTMAGFAVRVHESARSFLELAPGLSRACLVTDLRMPDLSGVELLNRLKEADSMVPAIVITGHGDVPLAVAAMKAGAVDFIEKPFEDDVLIDAITRAAKLLDRPSEDAGDESSRATYQSRFELLSDREKQVFLAVVGGLPNKTIAYDLDISPRTVEVHRANVMAKMQARSLPDLVGMALAMHLGGRKKSA